MESDNLSEEGTSSSSPGKTTSMNSINILNELRFTGKLTDAVIKAESRSFPVHRNIMSACSPYFRALFTNDMFNTDRGEVMIPGITADMMEIIIDYAYTKHVNVTPENVEVLLPAADQFHVNGIVKACCDFLTSQLCPDNCLGIYRFAANFFCQNLEKASYKYIMQNFVDICEDSVEFIQLRVNELCSFLSSDELNVKNEEVAFEAVIRWIDYDPDRRKIHIAKLLRSIRLGLLTYKYFVERVQLHKYVKDSEACNPIVIDTLKVLYDLNIDDEKDEKDETEAEISDIIARPRVPHEMLFVVGGWSGGYASNIVETYDTRADTWVVSETLDTGGRAYHGVAALGHRIYVIGGFDGTEQYNSVRCFNPISKTWTEVAPMNSKRCFVSVAVLDGLIYAMGGYDGHNRLMSAERYQARTNQWSLIQHMSHKRSDASATALNGRVYVCGGFNGQECLRNAESYDPQTNQWTMIAPMYNRRSGVGIIAYRDHIYALGGFDGGARMNTGERYNPVTNTWQTIPEMYKPRSNFAIEVIDDMLFVIGGFDGNTTIFNVECFEATANEWYSVMDMNLYRSALCACVVFGLPNVRDYIEEGRDKEVVEPKRRKIEKTNE